MTIKLYTGDTLACLAKLPDESVQCVVTSPPYWGLRDYGTAAWQGGDPGCDHADHRYKGTRVSNSPKQQSEPGSFSIQYRDLCGKCGARRIDAQLGLEPTPDAYVAKMVAVFREVKRVLRDDGTCWVNLGDSYAGGKTGNTNGGSSSGLKNDGRSEASRQRTNGSLATDMERMSFRKPQPPGLKPKDLVGIPWRVAFALQADGWFLRADIIWAKPNPMPESVRDRPTKSHEYVFLLTKRARYFYDADAIREIGVEPAGVKKQMAAIGRAESMGRLPSSNEGSGNGWVLNGARNARSVWTITPKPFKGAHFATFPPALVERCVKAGTSEAGCCPNCGEPWERVTETQRAAYRDVLTPKLEARVEIGLVSRKTGLSSPGWRKAQKASSATLGFRPACTCPAAEPVPCVVLDPFSGAGTVALVSKQLGRDAIGIDLNPAYNAMARKRIAAVSVPKLAPRHSPLATL